MVHSLPGRKKAPCCFSTGTPAGIAKRAFSGRIRGGQRLDAARVLEDHQPQGSITDLSWSLAMNR